MHIIDSKIDSKHFISQYCQNSVYTIVVLMFSQRQKYDKNDKT